MPRQFHPRPLATYSADAFAGQGGGLCEGVESLSGRPCRTSRQPVVDQLKKRRRIGGTVLTTQQPGKARGGAQFPGQGTLPARPVERLAEAIIGRDGPALSQRGDDDLLQMAGSFGRRL